MRIRCRKNSCNVLIKDLASLLKVVAKSVAICSKRVDKLICKFANQAILTMAFAARRNAKGSDEPEGIKPKPNILTKVSNLSAKPTTCPVRVWGKISSAFLGK